MSSIPELPLEIQHSIISCVAEPDSSDQITETLRACSLVSKGWHAGAQRWILQRLQFTIHFTDKVASNREAARQCKTIKQFLAFVGTNPGLKRHIESIHLDITSSTTTTVLDSGTCNGSPMNRIRDLAEELKDTIREVWLSFSSPELLVQSGSLRKRLYNLCSGSMLHTLYLHNTVVPSTLLAQPDIRTLILDDCTGVRDDIGEKQAKQLREKHLALKSHNGNIGCTLDMLVVYDSDKRQRQVFTDLWNFVQQTDYAQDLLSRIKSLDVCLTKSIPAVGMHDRVLYSKHLQSLTLSYIAPFCKSLFFLISTPF